MISSKQRIAALTDPRDGSRVFSVAFSPTGWILATGDGNGSTYLWDITTGHRIATFTESNSERQVYSVAFSSDATRLATGDSNGASTWWHLG